jgi:hypothetical protein
MDIRQELSLIRENYDKTIQLISGGGSTITGQHNSAPLLFNQKGIVNMIEFYTNSKYLLSQKDELGREKPFYNILNGICDVENAAKDIDTKDITITSDDPNHYLEAYLLSKDIQVWMKEVNFAKTLNDMRDTDTRYGSVLVKKVIKKQEDGKKLLEIELPEWKNMITDQVDILKGAKVEIHYLTASELVEMTEWYNVDKVLDKLKDQGSSKRVPVYEVRGNFSKSLLKNVENEYFGTKNKITEKDKKTYSNQLYYIAGNPIDSGDGDFLETLCVLYWEDDTEKVYKYKSRKKRAGRAFGVGVFEEGEQAQVWTNDAVLKQYRAMEYTTKVVMQTASKKLKGRNILNETDDGTTLEHEDGKPVTRLDLLPSGGLQQYNNLILQWNDQLEKVTSSYAAQRGENPPSGTPYRLQALVLNQSNSVFVNLLEDLGIFVGELFNDWIMPYLATRMNQEHILAYEFSAEELKEIDKNFSIRNANQKATEAILSGKIVTQEEYDAWIQSADTFIKGTKGQRFIQIPKNFYKNLKAKVTVNITGEQKNKAAVLESLNSVLVTYMNALKSGINLGQDPVFTLLLNEIIETSGAGISPVSITSALSENSTKMAQQQAQAQQMQQQGNIAQPEALSLATNPI